MRRLTITFVTCLLFFGCLLGGCGQEQESRVILNASFDWTDSTSKDKQRDGYTNTLCFLLRRLEIPVMGRLDKFGQVFADSKGKTTKVILQKGDGRDMVEEKTWEGCFDVDHLLRDDIKHEAQPVENLTLWSEKANEVADLAAAHPKQLVVWAVFTDGELHDAPALANIIRERFVNLPNIVVYISRIMGTRDGATFKLIQQVFGDLKDHLYLSSMSDTDQLFMDTVKQVSEKINEKK